MYYYLVITSKIYKEKGANRKFEYTNIYYFKNKRFIYLLIGVTLGTLALAVFFVALFLLLLLLLKLILQRRPRLVEEDRTHLLEDADSMVDSRG